MRCASGSTTAGSSHPPSATGSSLAVSCSRSISRLKRKRSPSPKPSAGACSRNWRWQLPADLEKLELVFARTQAAILRSTDRLKEIKRALSTATVDAAQHRQRLDEARRVLAQRRSQHRGSSG